MGDCGGTQRTGGVRSRRRAVRVLSWAIAGLALIPAQASGGTWYITPTITNNTRSTADTCPGHPNYVGCMTLDTSGVVTGTFISAPPSTGGRHELPANTDNVDQPAFEAPYFAEGADGYFGYTMPDGTEFSIVAEDDVNFWSPLYYPGCGVKPGQGPGDYTCLATYPPDGTTQENFQPLFDFYPNEPGAAPHTAAGQVCSTTSGTVICASGLQCNWTGPAKKQCTNPVQTNGTGQWSPTDPDNYMWLNVINLGDSSITITDLFTTTGDGPNGQEQCTLAHQGDTCAFITSGGCALVHGSCPGSDAIQMSVGGGASSGSAMVLQQAEITESMITESAELNSELQSEIWYAFTSGGDGAIEAAPRITRLRATVTSRAAGAARASRRPDRVHVSYRNSHAASSVLTLARGRPGMRRRGRCVAGSPRERRHGRRCTRWTALPGLRPRTATDTYWTPPAGRACPPGARRGQREGGRCHVRHTLSGHRHHRDRAGPNRMRFWPADGGRLAPGRYRATVVALAGRLRSRPASTTFRIGRRP